MLNFYYKFTRVRHFETKKRTVFKIIEIYERDIFLCVIYYLFSCAMNISIMENTLLFFKFKILGRNYLYHLKLMFYFNEVNLDKKRNHFYYNNLTVS